MTARLEEWESRFADLIEAARNVPFDWGSHDCVTFAADAVEAVTGVRHWMADHDATTADEAADAIAAAAPGRTLTAAVTLVLGHHIPVVSALRGDIVIGRWAYGAGALGVVTGAAIAAPGPYGLLFAPRDDARRAWRNGDR